MKNSNLDQIYCAEYLRVAMQIVGRSYKEIVSILSNRKVKIIGDFLEVCFEDTTLSGPLSNKMKLEEVYLFPDDDLKIFRYFKYLHSNFEYSFELYAWILSKFYVRINFENEWCILVKQFQI